MKKIFNVVAFFIMLFFASCEQDGLGWKAYGIGAFSVSADKQVTFSPGNLEYNKNTFGWAFSENSLDGVGDRYHEGWIDKLAWDNFVDDNFVDWGMYAIGKDAPNTWRSLEKEELEYLLFTRENADKLFGVAAVYKEYSDWDCRGLILLPDNWECPNGITFVPGVLDGGSVGSEGYHHHQMLTIEEWSKMEKKGAVFLRTNTFDSDGWVDGTYSGYYFLAALGEYKEQYFLYFDHETMPEIIKGYGESGAVRLVKDL